MMSIQATLTDCTPCSLLRFQSLLPPSVSSRGLKFRNCKPYPVSVSLFVFVFCFEILTSFGLLIRFETRRKRGFRFKAVEADEAEPGKNEDGEKETEQESMASSSSDVGAETNSELEPENEQVASSEAPDSTRNIMRNTNEDQILFEVGIRDEEKLKVTSGSPLPGVKPQQFDESVRIPKATVDVFRDQVFGFGDLYPVLFVTAECFSKGTYEGSLI